MAALFGCTPPYPTRKRVQGPQGSVADLPDRSLVQPGKSSRAEVAAKFKIVDTGVVSPWFFWGRWNASSVSFRGLTDSGFVEIPIWSATNLLVEFDEAGLAKKPLLLSDSRIVLELQRIVAAHPVGAQALKDRLQMEAQFYPASHAWCRGKIVASSHDVEIQAGTKAGKCPAGFKTPAGTVTMSPLTPPVGEFDPGPVDTLRINLRFSVPTSMGSEILVRMSVADVFSFQCFLQAVQTAPH